MLRLCEPLGNLLKILTYIRTGVHFASINFLKIKKEEFLFIIFMDFYSCIFLVHTYLYDSTQTVLSTMPYKNKTP